MSVLDELLKRFKFTFTPRKAEPDISVMKPAETKVEDFIFPISVEGRGTLVETLATDAPIADAPIAVGVFADPGPKTAEEFVEKLDLPEPPVTPKRTRKPKAVVEGAEAPKPKRTRKPKPTVEEPTQ